MKLRKALESYLGTGEYYYSGGHYQRRVGVSLLTAGASAITTGAELFSYWSDRINAIVAGNEIIGSAKQCIVNVGSATPGEGVEKLNCAYSILSKNTYYLRQLGYDVWDLVSGMSAGILQIKERFVANWPDNAADWYAYSKEYLNSRIYNPLLGAEQRTDPYWAAIVGLSSVVFIFGTAGFYFGHKKLLGYVARKLAERETKQKGRQKNQQLEQFEKSVERVNAE